VELEQTRREFEQRGLHVAALSHDSIAVLDFFAKRKGITYPLLSNVESAAAATLGIVNPNYKPGDDLHGMPFPGTFFIDENGVVVDKFFESDHRERYTASTMLVKHFHDPTGKALATSETKHLKLTSSASEETVEAGNRITLSLQIELKPKMHVYAPGIEGGYIPIRWKMPDSAGWAVTVPSYPDSQDLHLPAINETVPVYEGSFVITRDLVIGQDKEIKPLLQNGALRVEGAFRYQACDDKMCFTPQTVPLSWSFQVNAHDEVEAPAELRHYKK